MIPEANQAVVTRALQAAFGVSEYEDVQPLTGGLSTAQVYKIMVKGDPYLVKLLRQEVISDPKKEFACMQTAAGVGIAPRVRYANVEDRLLITDFIEARPLPHDPLPLIVDTLRKLHALPGFPKVVNYFDAIDSFIHRFQAANILPESETEELFRRYAQVQQVYPRHEADLVACHNDLKPQNMRFDGNRILLVDWESAFLNDRYVDLSIVANFFVRDEAQEDAYLHAYFGEEAGEYRRSRFYLVRQAVSVFYATLLLLEAAGAGLNIDAGINVPNFSDYHRDLIADKIDMLTAEAKLQYGILHLREALRNMRTPRFEAAVALAGGHHASE